MGTNPTDGSRSRHSVGTQYLGTISDGRKNAFSRQSRVGLKNLLDRLAGAQFLQDLFHRYTSAFDYRFAHHYFGI